MNTKTSEVKAHAKYSASGSDRWLNCPGSLALSENAPPQRESAYAQEGTEAHACLEFILKNRKNTISAVQIVKRKYPPDMVSHAVDAAHWIFTKQKEYKESELLCETRVDASPFTCEGQFGTLDAAIVEDFGRLVVIDYKYGAGVLVDPEENTQMIYYALGIAHKYDYNFSEVELVIIQPRAYHESGETIRSWIIPIEKLISYEQKFLNGVKAAEDPLAPLKAGKHCKWCPGSVICPEIKDRAMEQAMVVFDDEKGVENAPEPKQIQVSHLGQILDGCDKLETWISKVREHAIHVLERNEKIKGWKLVAKNSPRRWLDKENTAKEAKKKFGNFAFSDPELLSPAQLEKVFGKNNKKIETWIETRVTNQSSGTTLVPESDKRMAVNPIETAFSIIDETEEGGNMAKKQTKKQSKKAVKKNK